jgi:hypothetical protein
VGGLLIGVSSILFPALPWWSAFFEVFDAPLPALAVPGFFAGVFFATVVGILGRRQRLNELSLARFSAWGAAAGVLVTALPFALVSVGLASTEGSNISAWKAISVITGPFILFSAGSAALTLLLARKSVSRTLHRDEVFDASLDDDESSALLGAGTSSISPGERTRSRDREPRA